MKTILLIILFSLTACSVHPFIYKDTKGRVLVSMGYSFLTKSDYQGASIENGKMVYTQKNKNEISATNSYFTAETLKKLYNSIFSDDNTKEIVEDSTKLVVPNAQNIK